MPRLLITGAGGYIGSRLVLSATAAGYDVLAIDDFSRAQVRSFDGHRIVKKDIRDPGFQDEISGVDCVLHLAAISGVREAIKRPELALSVNEGGTKNVVQGCRKGRIPLVLASSMAVIGKPQRFPIDEETPCKPLNPYGMSKLLAERAAATLGEADIPAVALRITNVFGVHNVSGRLVRKDSVVNRFVERAQHAQPLKVYAPGTQARDFISVLDVTAAFLKAAQLALQWEFPEFRIINVGGGRSTEVAQLAEIVIEVAETEGLTHGGATRVTNPRGSSEILESRFEVDVSQARKLLGFMAQFDLEDYVRSALVESSEIEAPET